MSTLHDPTRHVNYLQQCLSQDKRSLGVFVAAGCPVSIRVPVAGGTEPLIPDVRGLTDLVDAKLGAGAHAAAFKKVVKHLTDDGHTAINVEMQLSFIRGLKAIAGAGKVRDLTVADLTSLEEAICTFIGERVDRSLPPGENPYSDMAAWIGSANRSEPVEIFTTNYDLLSEQALERFRIPYFDGFSGSKDAFLDSHSIDHDELPSRWARLWKLHGSINWTLNAAKQVCRGGTLVCKSIIHPSHLKYDESRRMPYLAMIDRLRTFIRKPSSVLLVCGYSFRDEHLNACLLEGLTGSPRSAVFGLLHGNLADYTEAAKLAGTAGNLSLMARDGAIIGTRSGGWDSRDPGDTGIWAGAVELAPDPAGGGGKVASFHLGDFARLGKFLAALIGRDAPGGLHAI
jgi:hypothetical protein